MHNMHVTDFYGVDREKLNKLLDQARRERNQALRSFVVRLFSWGGRNQASEDRSAPSQANPVGSA